MRTITGNANGRNGSIPAGRRKADDRGQHPCWQAEERAQQPRWARSSSGGGPYNEKAGRYFKHNHVSPAGSNSVSTPHSNPRSSPRLTWAVLAKLISTAVAIREADRRGWKRYLEGCAVVVLITLAGLQVGMRIAPSNLVMLYLLGVVFVSIKWGLWPAFPRKPTASIDAVPRRSCSPWKPEFRLSAQGGFAVLRGGGANWRTCLHGYGFCLWRVGKFDDAYRVFERMLWLYPPDNQGVRFLIADVQARFPWESRRDK